MSNTSTFTAKLNNYSSKGWWENGNVTAQGDWGWGVRTGVMYFAGLTSLQGKAITSVSIKVTSQSSGNNVSKTAYFYESAHQGGIDTSLNAGHKTGSSFKSVTGVMYNNTKTFTVNEFIAKIKAGQDTFCIYATGSANYFKWSNVVLTVVWDEPTSTFTATDKMTMNSAYNVVISNNNTSYTHTVRMVCGNDNQTFFTKTTNRSVSITPKLTFANQTPNNPNISATLYVDTYNGTTLLGTRSKVITLSVPASVKPTAGTLTLSAYSSPTGYENFAIQGYTKIKAVLSGYSGLYGATVSIKIAGFGSTVTTDTLITDTITTSDDVQFTATVTDSRGRSSTAIAVAHIFAYSKPKFAKVFAYRSDVDGGIYSNGEYLTAAVNATISDIPNNVLVAKLHYKTRDDSSWTEVVLENATLTTVSISTENIYDVKITISDNLSDDITYCETIGTKIVVISKRVDADGNAHVTFGGLSVDDGAVFEMPVAVHNELEVTGNLKTSENLIAEGSTTVGGRLTATGIVSNAGFGTKTINNLADLKSTGFVTFNASLDVGGVTVPKYAKGTLTLSDLYGNSYSTTDAVLMVVDAGGNLYTAFRNGGNWTNGREL